MQGGGNESYSSGGKPVENGFSGINTDEERGKVGSKTLGSGKLFWKESMKPVDRIPWHKPHGGDTRKGKQESPKSAQVLGTAGC